MSSLVLSSRLHEIATSRLRSLSRLFRQWTISPHSTTLPLLASQAAGGVSKVCIRQLSSIGADQSKLKKEVNEYHNHIEAAEESETDHEDLSPSLPSPHPAYVRGQMVIFDVVAVTNLGLHLSIKDKTNSKGLITNSNIEAFNRVNKKFKLGDKDQVGYIIRKSSIHDLYDNIETKRQMLSENLPISMNGSFNVQKPSDASQTLLISLFPVKCADTFAKIKTRIIETISKSPHKKIPIGDRSPTDEVKIIFPGMSKSEFNNATKALDKEGLLSRDKFSTSFKMKPNR